MSRMTTVRVQTVIMSTKRGPCPMIKQIMLTRDKHVISSTFIFRLTAQMTEDCLRLKQINMISNKPYQMIRQCGMLLYLIQIEFCIQFNNFVLKSFLVFRLERAQSNRTIMDYGLVRISNHCLRPSFHCGSHYFRSISYLQQLPEMNHMKDGKTLKILVYRQT